MNMDWRADLDRWLAPFVAALRHKTRADVSRLYCRTDWSRDRKSVQPMAARAGEVGYDQLHHFVAAGVWDSAPLEAALLKEADALVGDEAGFLSLMTPRCLRRDVTRLASRHNMPRRSERPPTVSRWFQ